MTDATSDTGSVVNRKPDLSAKRVGRRYAAEARFQAYGLIAIFIAVAVLASLIGSIVSQGLPAFTQHKVTIEVEFPADEIDPDNLRAANFQAMARRALYERFPSVTARRDKRELADILSGGADVTLKEFVEADPSVIGTRQKVTVSVSDSMDTFLKGQMTDIDEYQPKAELSPTGTEGELSLLASGNVFADILADVKQTLEEQSDKIGQTANRERRGITVLENDVKALRARAANAVGAERENLEGRIKTLESSINSRIRKAANLDKEAAALFDAARSGGGTLDLTEAMPSILIEINGGIVKALRVSNETIEGEAFVPLDSDTPAQAGEWTVVKLVTPETGRQIKDRTATWLLELQKDGSIESTFADVLFSKGDSRAPEQAGIWGAVVGSFLTLTITLLLSFPIAVLAAIYLEEFAPQNRITDLIEVNINNLAAVPSIVFGLLGLAMFLNFFGLPRSAPLVGGMVLALMTLPTIIIATRAALKAVPPSIREAALGVGASKVQVITHHVLPLAMPGILTGTIIGMAQALGETAPLLMIGMVAFIVDVPGGFTDPATVLPVQIYIWADSPERAFVAKTSAAIMVLLTFLVLMNALAVLLRRRFERRW